MATRAKSSNHGRFSKDDPQTEWLTEPAPDRNMTLVRPFYFVDPAGKQWDVPSRYKIDGASIPRALWTAVGSPYTGDYRRASIAHDKAARDAGSNAAARLAADRMFYHACRAGGCSVLEATILYLGVRIGSILPLVRAFQSMPDEDGKPRLDVTAQEQRLQADFRLIGAQVLKAPLTDDPKVLEKKVSAQFTAYYGVAPATRRTRRT